MDEYSNNRYASYQRGIDKLTQERFELRTEITTLKAHVRTGALLLKQGALPNSFAVQDYLKEVEEIREGKDG